MGRKEFDRILQSEGLESQRLRDIIWRERPSDDLDELRLRKAARWFKRTYPQACREEATNQDIVKALRS